MTKDFKITHIVEGDKHDFNLRGLPDDLILPLKNALGWEHQVRMGIRNAPHFREERAMQHQRYLEHCAATGADPRQQFIDFPINR